jgi:hypothetical protein
LDCTVSASSSSILLVSTTPPNLNLLPGPKSGVHYKTLYQWPAGGALRAFRGAARLGAIERQSSAEMPDDIRDIFWAWHPKGFFSLDSCTSSSPPAYVAHNCIRCPALGQLSRQPKMQHYVSNGGAAVAAKSMRTVEPAIWKCNRRGLLLRPARHAGTKCSCPLKVYQMVSQQGLVIR